ARRGHSARCRKRGGDLAELRPERAEILGGGGGGAHRHAEQLHALHPRRGEIGAAGGGDGAGARGGVGAERGGPEGRGPVREGEGLERNGRQALPAWRGVDLIREPASEGEVAADMRTDALDAQGAEDEPDLERAEAAAERDSPVAVVLHRAVLCGAEVARVGG